ncbi:hypothetical protein BDV93DRAFT_515350 [Ceratobasidium sp. AG-I]|nr:hypothetical protein BDV93DRAFT_515350 [Ceratobasidium sp. AG-I]
MFPLRIKDVFTRVSTSPMTLWTTPPSYPNAFGVDLTHDWSDTKDSDFVDQSLTRQPRDQPALAVGERRPSISDFNYPPPAANPLPSLSHTTHHTGVSVINSPWSHSSTTDRNGDVTDNSSSHWTSSTTDDDFVSVVNSPHSDSYTTYHGNYRDTNAPLHQFDTLTRFHGHPQYTSGNCPPSREYSQELRVERVSRAMVPPAVLHDFCAIGSALKSYFSCASVSCLADGLCASNGAEIVQNGWLFVKLEFCLYLHRAGFANPTPPQPTPASLRYHNNPASPTPSPAPTHVPAPTPPPAFHNLHSPTLISTPIASSHTPNFYSYELDDTMDANRVYSPAPSLDTQYTNTSRRQPSLRQAHPNQRKHHFHHPYNHACSNRRSNGVQTLEINNPPISRARKHTDGTATVSNVPNVPNDMDYSQLSSNNFVDLTARSPAPTMVETPRPLPAHYQDVQNVSTPPAVSPRPPLQQTARKARPHPRCNRDEPVESSHPLFRQESPPTSTQTPNTRATTGKNRILSPPSSPEPVPQQRRVHRKVISKLVSSDDESDYDIELVDTGYQNSHTSSSTVRSVPPIRPRLSSPRKPQVLNNRPTPQDETYNDFSSLDDNSVWDELDAEERDVDMRNEDNSASEAETEVPQPRQKGNKIYDPQPVSDAVAVNAPYANWTGATGGPLKFCGKNPAGANPFSRWSYSTNGPDIASAHEHVEGDIHFSPSYFKGTNDPFLYWVCISGFKGKSSCWVKFNCGQQHPLHNGFVLTPQFLYETPREDEFRKAFFLRHQTLLSNSPSPSSGPWKVWLAIAFVDSNLSFVDFRNGRIVGMLNFGSRFNVAATAWRSDHVLIVGCSNGSVFHLDFDVESKRPVVMHSLVKPLPSAIRALAYDALSEYLAVGYANQVSIFSRSTAGSLGVEYWNCLDQIPPPPSSLGNSKGSLVTCIAFFGASHRRRHLFVGYAQAGFLVWMLPGNYMYTDAHNPGVKPMGDAVVSADQQSIAISTLYQTAMIYPLTDSGPVVSRGAEYSLRERSGYSPAVPIALTANNILLKGTATGEVWVLSSERKRLKSLSVSSNHIIRALGTFGDRVVVGSSANTYGSAGNEKHAMSDVSCFTTLPTSDYRDWPVTTNDSKTPFELSVDDVMPESEHAASYQSMKRAGAGGKSNTGVKGIEETSLAVQTGYNIGTMATLRQGLDNLVAALSLLLCKVYKGEICSSRSRNATTWCRIYISVWEYAYVCEEALRNRQSQSVGRGDLVVIWSYHQATSHKTQSRIGKV